MKTLTSLIIAIMSVSLVYSQHPLRLVKEKVGNPDILKNWSVGEAKFVNQTNIVRQEGENEYENITNVFYTPKNMLMQRIDENATAEAYIPDAKMKLLQIYEEAAPGGQIALFYCRPDKKLAEPGNFLLRVIDEDDKTVWTGSLENEQPLYYKWDIWYYYKTINVPVAVDQNFTIQLYDVPSAKTFEFKVAINHELAEERQPNLSLKPAYF